MRTIKIVAAIAVIVVLILVVVLCLKKNKKYAFEDIIEVDKIIEISVKTQMTDQVQEIILDENKSKETVEVLKRYTLRAVNEEIPKGWEYWFKIKTKTGEMISVSFLGADALNSTESRVVIDRVMYVLTGYNSDDFLFLFDKEK